MLDDYDYLTGHSLAHAWQVRHGRLEEGERLVPRRPFVLGGAYAVDNLQPMSAVRAMKTRAALARQVCMLPDGTGVRPHRAK